jgi:hypothetical protein
MEPRLLYWNEAKHFTKKYKIYGCRKKRQIKFLEKFISWKQVNKKDEYTIEYVKVSSKHELSDRIF